MSSDETAPTTAVDILEKTRDVLLQREARLRQFGDELQRTTQARKELDKTIGRLRKGAALAAPGSRERSATALRSASPRDRFTQKVVELLREDGGMNAQQIGQALNRGVDDYLNSILTTAVLKGLLTEDDGEYRAP